MVGVCNVLQTVSDPLSLSLALDICEEVLQAGESRRVARRIARAGALAALVNALHFTASGICMCVHAEVGAVKHSVSPLLLQAWCSAAARLSGL